MAEEAIAVGVIVEKRKAQSPWIDHLWVPVAVVPGMPEAPPLTLVDRVGDTESYYLGSAALVLATNETANYRDNLMGGAPKLWVAMREEPQDATVSLLTVTADPAEGEALTEAGSNIVDVVPMAPEIAAFVAAFVDANHVEREFYKRKRDESGKDGKRRMPGGAQ